MREYILALRAIWRCWETGEKLNFRGEHYTFTLMTPNFVPPSTGQPPVPITIAAVGEHSLRLSGEACDGVRLHPFCTRAYLEDIVMRRIKEGFDKTGRMRDSFEVTGGGFIATGETEDDVQKVAEWVRHRIAFYGSTPSYWPVLEHHGYGDLGRKLNRMTKDGKWNEIVNEIPDDVLHLFAVIAPFTQLESAIVKRFGGTVDAIYASTSQDIRPQIPSDVLQDIARIPTAFSGFKTIW